MSLKKDQQNKVIRTLRTFRTRKWLQENGWESNGLKWRQERWRRRSFDSKNNWHTYLEAVDEQNKWNRFWD